VSRKKVSPLKDFCNNKNVNLHQIKYIFHTHTHTATSISSDVLKFLDNNIYSDWEIRL